MEKLDKEMQNFVKLHSILMQRAYRILRLLFRQTWDDSKGTEWDDTPEQGSIFINGEGQDFYLAAPEKQKWKLKSGCVEEWDITLLAHILLNFDFGIFNLNRTQKSKIRQLLDIRNDLAHHATNKISDQQLHYKWKQIENILIDFGDSEVELQNLRSKFEIFNDDEDDDDMSVAKWNEKGNIFFKYELYEDAIRCYTKALEYPNLPKIDLGRYYSNRSVAYLKLASEDSDVLCNALDDAKSALELRPDWNKPFYRLGAVYQAMEKYDEALKYFSTFLQYEPDNEDVKQLRKYCLEKFYE